MKKNIFAFIIFSIGILLLSSNLFSQENSTKEFYITNIKEIEKTWNNNEFKQKPEKYTLFDIDKDGKDELYLRNDKINAGIVFSCGNKQLNVICTENPQKELKYSKGKLLCSDMTQSDTKTHYGYELNNSLTINTFILKINNDNNIIYSCINQTGTDCQNKASNFFIKTKNFKSLNKSVQWKDYNTFGPNTTEEKILIIRKLYSDIQTYINLQNDDIQMQNNASLTFSHNFPGIGPIKYNYNFYFSPYEDVENLNHDLYFVQNFFNLTSNKFYEEYLYDENGECTFIFSKRPDVIGNAELIEIRIYFYQNEIIKMQIKEINGNSSKIISDKPNADEYSYYYEELIQRAETAKTIFDSFQNKMM